MEEGDGRGEEGGEAKVDGEGDGPVADEPGPPGDEGEEGAELDGRELEGPVVGAGGGWVAGGQLREGEGDAFGEDEDYEPAYEHGELAWRLC